MINNMHMYTRKSRPKNNEISLDSKDELKFYEKGLYHGVNKLTHGINNIIYY